MGDGHQAGVNVLKGEMRRGWVEEAAAAFLWGEPKTRDKENLVSFFEPARVCGEERTGHFEGRVGGAELGDDHQVGVNILRSLEVWVCWVTASLYVWAVYVLYMAVY